MATMELFRKTTIGKCLLESLDEMIKKGTLKPEHAIQIVLQFDKSMTEAVKMHATQRFSIKGHIDWYNFSEDVWTFALSDALIKTPIREKKPNENRKFCEKNIGKVKIVAVDSALFKQQ